MSLPIIPPIRLDAISKCYRIFQNPQDRFKQALLDRFQGVLGKKSASPLYREHWALRDVSFELQPGEAIGILGRNGAGKSTLLQIIAGTVAPSSGTVHTTGRVTALLELGSGFNPEFTGRENVFLNAQVLGLSHTDTLTRFDDIANFADIGDFIDQPVKTYSSGMMMRLAFAVQTAFEPKVLIVDEALSVGDMFFQAKCVARIRRLLDDGVSLLFVSHDVGAVRQLCSRAVLLSGGKAIAIGGVKTVVDQYLRIELDDRNRLAEGKPPLLCPRSDDKSDSQPVEERSGKESVAAEFSMSTGFDDDEGLSVSEWCCDMEKFEKNAQGERIGTGWAVIRNVQMLTSGRLSGEFDFDDEVEIRTLVAFNRGLSNVNLAIKVRTIQGTDVVFWDTRLRGQLKRSYIPSRYYAFRWRVHLPLQHGNYVLSVGLALPPMVPGEDWIFLDVVQHALDFKMRPRVNGMIGGLVALPASLDIVCLGQLKE